MFPFLRIFAEILIFRSGNLSTCFLTSGKIIPMSMGKKNATSNDLSLMRLKSPAQEEQDKLFQKMAIKFFCARKTREEKKKTVLELLSCPWRVNKIYTNLKRSSSIFSPIRSVVNESTAGMPELRDIVGV